MKRADLTTEMILGAVAIHGILAWEELIEDRPAKVVRAAIQREVDAGTLDYGVCVERPFLTDKGRAALVGVLW